MWTSVAHGGSHLCGITTKGPAACWGWNSSGQTEIPAGLAIGSVFVAYENTCAIGTDGALTCWGNEWTGLNDAPAGAFVQGAAAAYFACARTEEGEWSCWGRDVEPVEGGYVHDWTLPEEPLVALEGGDSNICGLDEDGAIHCWGVVDGGVTEPPPGTGYRNLSVGRHYACAIAPDDEVTCWGHVGEIWRAMPEGRWRDFDAGSWMDCGIREDGDVDCWGCAFSDPFACDWDD